MSIMKNIEVGQNLRNVLKPFRATATFEHDVMGIERVYGLDGKVYGIPKPFATESKRDYEFGTREELERFLRGMITE